MWLGRTLPSWMDLPEGSMLDMPLFPVVEVAEVPAVLNLLVHEEGDPGICIRARRLNSKAFTARTKATSQKAITAAQLVRPPRIGRTMPTIEMIPGFQSNLPRCLKDA